MSDDGTHSEPLEVRRKLSRRERRILQARRQASLSGEELRAYKGARREHTASYVLGASSALPRDVEGCKERLATIAVEKKHARERAAYEAMGSPPAWLLWMLMWAGRASKGI